MERQRHPVMAGVNRQVLGVHCGRAMRSEQPIAVDRRDCPSDDNRVELPHEFNCMHLVHFTENVFADNIGLSAAEYFIFRPQRAPITILQSYRLTWWSPLPPNNWKTVIENNLPNVDTVHFDIGNSAAFNGKSLCGPIGIVVKWHDILMEYAWSRGGIVADVEFRILGTFLYTREIMFGILVCMKGDADLRDYPLIDADGTEAFVPGSSREQFIWKVYSTVGYKGARPSDVFWTWDHVSFGFYCPTSNLYIRNRFCGFTNKEATRYRPKSRLIANDRSSFKETNACEELLDRLIAKK